MRGRSLTGFVGKVLQIVRQRLAVVHAGNYGLGTELADVPPDATQVFQPGTIDVVVAGGDAAPMMQAWHMYRPQTVSIDKWR